MNTKKDPDSGTRQERRAARRRTEILEAAIKVFSEKGFHRSTTKEIAEAADIAEGTIYNYFESKEDLLISLIDSIANLAYRRERYAQFLDIDVRQSVHDLMLERFSVIKERNRLFLAILPELFATPHLRELYAQKVMAPAIHDLEEHFRARIERNQLGDIDIPATVRMLSALGLGLELMIILDDTETKAIWDDVPRFVDMITNAIFDGLLIPPTKPDSASPD